MERNRMKISIKIVCFIFLLFMNKKSNSQDKPFLNLDLSFIAIDSESIAMVSPEDCTVANIQKLKTRLTEVAVEENCFYNNYYKQFSTPISIEESLWVKGASINSLTQGDASSTSEFLELLFFENSYPFADSWYMKPSLTLSFPFYDSLDKKLVDRLYSLDNGEYDNPTNYSFEQGKLSELISNHNLFFNAQVVPQQLVNDLYSTIECKVTNNEEDNLVKEMLKKAALQKVVLVIENFENAL